MSELDLERHYLRCRGDFGLGLVIGTSAFTWGSRALGAIMLPFVCDYV